MQPNNIEVMTTVLQIGDRTLSASEIMPLLASYNMIPQLLCESIIDSAIAPISLTQEQTTQAVEQFCQNWDFQTEEQRQAWCLRYGLTPEQLEKAATRKLRLEKFKQLTWGHQLESYFLKRKRELDKVIYSMIRTDNRGTVNELFFRIQAGEQSFAELAREYSQGSEAQTSGMVGPVEFGSLSNGFAQLLHTSQPGVVQPPLRFGEFWIIVRVEKLIPAQLDDFMRQRLIKENFEAWFQQQLTKLSPEEKIWMGINQKSNQVQETVTA